MLQGDLNLISMPKLLERGKGPKRMKQHHWHPKNQPKKPNTILDGAPSQNMQRRYGQLTCLKHPNWTWRNQNKNQHDTRERRKGQNYIMKTLWKGNRLKGLYKRHKWRKKTKGRYVHNKMNQTQLLCPFQKNKDLKLEIEMACNHCKKIMV
jgi:hypothetical protein